MKNERVITTEQVAHKEKVREMLPDERAVYDNNPKGHKRKYRADGNYSWTNTYKTNDHGKLTPEAEGAIRLMQPFVEADTARVGTIQEKLDRVRMVDSEGRVSFVEPAQANDSASRNGWRHFWRAGGLVTRSGPDGMLFRLWRDEWEPTGRLEVGILGRECTRDGIQRDPDGWSWWHDGEEWRRLDHGKADE